MNALDLIAELNPEALIADGFDDAIIGIAYRCGQEPVVAYDSQQILDILVHYGMTEDEAAEYYDFNIAGAYLGPGTPIYITTTENIYACRTTPDSPG